MGQNSFVWWEEERPFINNETGLVVWTQWKANLSRRFWGVFCVLRLRSFVHNNNISIYLLYVSCISQPIALIMSTVSMFILGVAMHWEVPHQFTNDLYPICCAFKLNTTIINIKIYFIVIKLWTYVGSSSGPSVKSNDIGGSVSKCWRFG